MGRKKDNIKPSDAAYITTQIKEIQTAALAIGAQQYCDWSARFQNFFFKFSVLSNQVGQSKKYLNSVTFGYVSEAFGHSVIILSCYLSVCLSVYLPTYLSTYLTNQKIKENKTT